VPTPVTSITYEITGGNFGTLYPPYTGPITGVSVTYTPPGGIVYTPYTCFEVVACGRLDFVMTGPGITMLPLSYTQWYYYLDFVLINPNHFSGTFDISQVFGRVYGTIHATSGTGAGRSGASFMATPSSLKYIIGNEIRLPSPIPTPTPTPTASPTPTPEPGLILQLVAGGVGLAFLNKRRVRKNRRARSTS
jgi:hypothetical protein